MNIIKRIFNAVKYGGGNPQTPQYWLQKLFGRTQTTAGIEIDQDTALKYSAVWAAVNIISGAVGFLPLVTYRRLERGRQRDDSHNVAALMHIRPNPFMDAKTFKETLQGHVLTWGNGYAEIERDGAGRPMALWPLLPNRTEPKIIDKNLFYEVTLPEKVVLLPHINVLHLKGLGFDGIKGYSVIEYAAENLSLGMAAEKNAATFFGNDSSPTGILKTTNSLSKETKTILEKDWEEKHKGIDKKYRIAILHSGLEWQQIGISAKDSQLIESRKFSVSDVARWFQMPPHMLADVEKSTSWGTGIEQQGIGFVTWTLYKWLKMWELEAAYKLFSTSEQKEYYLEFVVDALLRADSKSRAETYQIALGGNNNPGYMTVNEVREKENLPPLDSGDILFSPNYGESKKDTNNFAALIADAWRRINNKEIGAVRKAIKKPEQFLEWVEEFYEKHFNFMALILEPLFRAAGNNTAAPVIASHIESRKAELKAVFETSSEVEMLLQIWQEQFYEQAKINKSADKANRTAMVQDAG